MCPRSACTSWTWPTRQALAALLREKQCEAVIHFAAFIAVGESMREPATYFTNNVCGSLSLLDAMVQAGVKHIVFSSTAAVYGDPAGVADSGGRSRFSAVNPYGESKVMVETLLGWFDQIHDLTSVCLRYFNASGARPGRRPGRRARTGDAPDPAAVARGADGQADHHLRRRLRDAGRHVHSRLHPRERSGAGAHSGGGAIW